MSILILFGSFIVPLAMLYAQRKWSQASNVFNMLSLVSLLIFGNIAAMSIAGIIKDRIVFMTSIHGVFLNPVFLLSGAYLGVYFVYRVLLLTIEGFEEQRYRIR
ncbi:transposase [Cohnella herbarum]|uniref:Transposase n=1 Tax=Cohnella herbarum TaxID=2728023 RepID=A0A7Z2VH58_9BACL|nr:transposase [Cohnella herbarum]QJD82974.1 transposase [Cohnella herbarum]